MQTAIEDHNLKRYNSDVHFENVKVESQTSSDIQEIKFENNLSQGLNEGKIKKEGTEGAH